MLIKNDTDRISRYLDILRETNIYDFHHTVINNGQFEVYDETFDAYKDLKHSVFGTFDDKNLQKVLNKFDNAFDSLESCLNKYYKWNNEQTIGFYPRRFRIEETGLSGGKNDIKKHIEYFNSEYKKLLIAFRNYFKQNETSDRSKFIYKNGHDFFYSKNNKKIKFINHATKYYYLFCTLYDLSKDKDPISYKEIINHVNKKYKTSIESNQDISRLINNSLIHNSKKYNLILIRPDNENLIEVVNGVGIIFNNSSCI